MVIALVLLFLWLACLTVFVLKITFHISESFIEAGELIKEMNKIFDEFVKQENDEQQ